ncbi:unnamed protein product [Lactuca virosa]|uniref:Uncharacterized protein n=1 Tax=Lactuca virosa TaxID=75947 RepID=A0AAU9NRX6_9ASTR|nr:unnamed protein product [Lactuca virosa]
MACSTSSHQSRALSFSRKRCKSNLVPLGTSAGVECVGDIRQPSGARYGVSGPVVVGSSTGSKLPEFSVVRSVVFAHLPPLSSRRWFFLYPPHFRHYVWNLEFEAQVRKG